MKMIGITGGVGAGKSEILDYLSSKEGIYVIKADEISHSLMEKGEKLYHELTGLLGEDILDSDGNIIKARMGEKIFNDDRLLDKVNALIHPAVKEFVKNDRAEKERSGKYVIYFLEAALLIECGYDKICDELWYIYADIDVRRDRLKSSRGYSDEKTDSIINKQLPDEVFRQYCKEVIDNSGSREKSFEAIDRLISGYTG